MGLWQLVAANRREALVLALASLGVWAAFLALALGWGGAPMRSVMSLMMPMSAAWSLATATMVFAMWAVMMAAMMLPSALPMALAFAGLDRAQGRRGGRLAGFVSAYLAVWCGFSLLATGLQWALQSGGLIDAAGASRSLWFAGGLMIAAGALQFSTLKQACLRKCRTPLGFLMTQWRDGFAGTLVMGLRHGAYCVGCCGALMVLPFAAGTMNLWWMALLTAIVAAEKIVPHGQTFARGVGAALIAAGLVLLASEALGGAAAL